MRPLLQAVRVLLHTRQEGDFHFHLSKQAALTPKHQVQNPSLCLGRRAGMPAQQRAHTSLAR